VLSRHALGRDPGRDGIAELKVRGFPIHRRWHLVWRRDRPLGRPAAAFLEHLRERLKPPPA
jgi:DNA-binding transcriptional LysR family regulator